MGSDSEKSKVQRLKDVMTNPCFRRSMLFSITSGFVVGTGTYFLTDNPIKASKYWVLTFILTNLPSVICCHIYYRNKINEIKILSKGIEEFSRSIGTES